jgi:hypothetical protein
MNDMVLLLSVVLWVLVLVALVFRPVLVSEWWEGFRRTSRVVRVVGWVALLPWVLAVWIFESEWPVWSRVILIVALVWINLYTFGQRFIA